MSNLIISADPAFFRLAWDEFENAVTKPKNVTKLGDGVVLAGCNTRFTGLGERWRQRPPIFVRHICPATEAVDLSGTPSDLKMLKRTVREQFADDFPTGAAFSVQTRVLAKTEYKPFDVNKALSAEIETTTGATLSIREPTWVLSVVIGQFDGRLVGFVGASHVTHNLSDWAGGVRRLRREPTQVSRAEFKLIEALEVFGIELPAGGTAVDLGAAPGGWTRVLRAYGDNLHVVAVDPGALHPSILADKGVTYVSRSAENHKHSLDESVQYDVIVNDMRLDARRSAEVMNKYVHFLNQTGFAIMTVKLPQRMPRKLLDQTLGILRREYVIRQVRQLFHNRNEVTLHLLPKEWP